jgi:hypothetical protein
MNTTFDVREPEASSAPDEESLRELELDLAARQREYDEALEAWRRLARDEATVSGPGIEWTPPATIVRADGSERVEGRRTVRSTIEVDGRMRFVDEIPEDERALVLAELRDRRGGVGRELRDARARLRAAREIHANARLGPAFAAYEVVAGELDSARRQAESAIVEALRRLTTYGRASDATRRAMRRLRRIAAEGAVDAPALVEHLRDIDARGDVPVRLDESGVEAAGGAEFDLLGDDPRAEVTWQAIARLAWSAVNEPERAEAQLRGTALAQATTRQRGN